MGLRRTSGRLASRLVLCVAAVMLTHSAPVAYAGAGTPRQDRASQGHEKDAFESAKELGTADAWDAFLAAYPTGFYADLARAYLKKLETHGAGPPPTPSSARAAERPCSERSTLRSKTSDAPTRLTFINTSGLYRAISQIDFDGSLKDYGGLNPGEQMVVDTFHTHPWMIATGPGDCLQIFLPAAEPATVELVRLAADDAKSAPAKKQNPPARQPQAEKKKPLVCAKNYTLKNGACVVVQNCGKNASRNAEGDCHCHKGYVMRKGKCVWPQDKKGFEVAPWKKTGCKGLQAQCNQGNGKACMKYEETCQVN